MTNSVDNMTYLELDEKLADMKKIFNSLRREIDANQVQALNFREEMKALGEKLEEKRKELRSINTEIERARNTLLSADGELLEMRRKNAIERNELDSIRTSLEKQQADFSAWRAETERSTKEALERAGNSEKEAQIKLQEAHERYLQLDAVEKELSDRKIRVVNDELASSKLSEEAKKNDSVAKENLRASQKALDDAQAQKVMYDELFKGLNARQTNIETSEKNLKICLADLEMRGKAVKSDERDLAIEKNRLRSIKESLMKEIEASTLPKETKVSIVKEVKSNQ